MPPPRGVDKRDKRKRDRDPSTVSQPLEAQLEEDKVAKLKTKKKSKPEKAHQEEEDMMSAEISKKVMREARKQMEEVGAEERAKDKDAVQAIGTGQVGRATLNAAAFKVALPTCPVPIACTASLSFALSSAPTSSICLRASLITFLLISALIISSSS
mmetsp:Transcript_40585/g.49231  ORF Transcript_40585/g.49231 Transcript_40585/m.49231 type:complete len:157 (-) Transcript_40585:528-998(-)